MPSTGPERRCVAVACGVLQEPGGKVLICQRPPGKIAAGKWEFPGGKKESGETSWAALQRELQEELGISSIRGRPLIRVTHDYSDRRVELDTWLVSGWSGLAVGRENQELAWVELNEISRYDLLAADGPIVEALRLPPCYVFTPPDIEPSRIEQHLCYLPRGALLRLRLPRLSEANYAKLAADLVPAAAAQGLRIVVDRHPGLARELARVGWHVRADELRRWEKRPAELGLVLASCHDEHEIRRARDLPADAVVTGPVCATRTHPGEIPMGWQRFGHLAQMASMATYAIGGMTLDDVPRAQQRYGQGIAGISTFWT